MGNKKLITREQFIYTISEKLSTINDDIAMIFEPILEKMWDSLPDVPEGMDDKRISFVVSVEESDEPIIIEQEACLNQSDEIKRLQLRIKELESDNKRLNWALDGTTEALRLVEEQFGMWRYVHRNAIQARKILESRIKELETELKISILPFERRINRT
jgi:hypothetical protein